MSGFRFFSFLSSYDPITLAYVNGMATKPSSAFISLIDAYFVKNKKTVNGVEITAKSLIAKADVIYLGNINDSDDSYRNLVKNAHHGTKQGSGLVWDAYWGYSNPAGTGYVDTNYNPSTEGSTFTQNAAGFGINLHTNVTAANTFAMGVKATNYVAFKTNGENFAVNQAALLARASVPFRAGLHGFFRTLSNAINAKNQNLENTTGTNTSTARPNGNVYLFDCNGDSAPYTGGLNFVFKGGILTDDEFTALNLIVNEYLIQSIYTKYGKDNWGVQMAKSYFDTLHNFEPYEAWEVYEFIKRMQSDYVDGAATGYYYNTFGPGSAVPKTVADFIMLFKAGGNLTANALTKTGATLRWSQDGQISNSNTMPAYTRGTNLGIVTVTSTDGWNGVTTITLTQGNNSVNSFYGNMPKFLGILKTLGSKCNLILNQNKLKLYFIGIDKTLLTGINALSLNYPAGLWITTSDIVGGSYSGAMNFGGKNGSGVGFLNGSVTINMSLFTNEFVQTFYFYNFEANVTGSLENLIIPNTVWNIVLSNNYITKGTSTFNKNIANFLLNLNFLNTSAVDSQLSVINTYFATNTPIKNVTVNLSGATMGIPTGGSSNTDLLGIVAKHIAAGFTATITVRTS